MSKKLTSVSSGLVDADVVAPAVVLLALVDVDARRDVVELIPGRADARRDSVDHVTLVVAAVVRRTVDGERLFCRRRRRRMVLRRLRRRRSVWVDVAVGLNPGPAFLLAEQVPQAGSGKLVSCRKRLKMKTDTFQIYFSP